jgi:hypothetical protein
MNYSFKIDNYNRADDLLGVVYIPEDPRLSGSFIRVAPGQTEEETIRNIKMMAPVEVWELEASRLEDGKMLDQLVGKTGEGTDQETNECRCERESEVPVDQLGIQAKISVTMASQFHMEEVITGQYPDYERQSWIDQEREARAYMNDPEGHYPLLMGISAARGLGLEDLAERVVKKADNFRALVAEFIGKRQAICDQIDEIVAEWEAGSITEAEARAGIQNCS